jgi:Fe-S-cluster containining protein
MSCLCDQCSALCCRYFVLEIDTPETRSEFDNIRWYLVHENVFVFIEKKKWYLGIYSRCKHLGDDNRCGIYATRPRICREYSTENCDYHGGDYNWSKLFSSAEQLQAYADEQLAERALERLAARRRRAKQRASKQQQAPRPVRQKPKRRLPKLNPALILGQAMAGAMFPPNGHPPARNGKAFALPVLRA